MSRAAPTILTVCLVLVIGLFAGARGTLCLGGGHNHLDSEQPAHCEHACPHAESHLPIEPGSEHDEHCSCVDLDLGRVERATAPRAAGQPHDSLAAAPTAVIERWEPQSVGPRIGSPPPPGDHAGVRLALVIVRSTRITI